MGFELLCTATGEVLPSASRRAVAGENTARVISNACPARRVTVRAEHPPALDHRPQTTVLSPHSPRQPTPKLPTKPARADEFLAEKIMLTVRAVGPDGEIKTFKS